MSPKPRRHRSKRPRTSTEFSRQSISSPTRALEGKPVHSPDEGGLLSPGFTLCSPAGGLPPATSTLISANIDSSLFDMNSNLVNQVHSDLLRTFQIATISKGIIPSLLPANITKEISDFQDSKTINPPLVANLSDSNQMMERVQFVSPVSETKPRNTIKRVTDTSSIQCKCLKSKCLKLYCDCLASSKYCEMNCKCEDCMNTNEFENVFRIFSLLTSDHNFLC